VAEPKKLRTCYRCGCTNLDCSGCIARTGKPCHWVGVALCSACVRTGEKLGRPTAGDTGIAVGRTTDGMVYIARVVDGVEEWGEEVAPELAIQIAEGLLDCAGVRR